MVDFEENYHFSRFQRGSNIFQGGSNFFQGGSNCLFPIETHITCDFPGGGSEPPVPPSGSELVFLISYQSYARVQIWVMKLAKMVAACLFAFVDQSSHWTVDLFQILYMHFINHRIWLLSNEFPM